MLISFYFFEKNYLLVLTLLCMSHKLIYYSVQLMYTQWLLIEVVSCMSHRFQKEVKEKEKSKD